jgi:hypothetical protein
MTKPAIEDCTDFQIGCFNFDYTELTGSSLINHLEIFNKAELTVWDNLWSEYNLFSGQDVTYFDSLAQTEFISDLKKNMMVDLEIAEKDHPSIPFTFGNSYDYKDPTNCVTFE